jgi:hypothetical protein
MGWDQHYVRLEPEQQARLLAPMGKRSHSVRSLSRSVRRVLELLNKHKTRSWQGLLEHWLLK